MLVSQYIYTACGKDRKGAFSVFSKSKDITDEESSEIREVMIYKTPSGLPYEPTDQEINEKFPVKFGYFLLSSGRACLAQVCYVGRVYSDNDSRWGNYIIHAFVFEKKNDFSPYSFIDNKLFKRKLTQKEWHDDPIPEDYPKIEIPENGGMLTAEEMTTFFNEDRKNKLSLLLEAIIQTSPDNVVSFNDDFKNQKCWIKIIGLCLPKQIQNKITFCSHFTNIIVPGNISSRIQIRVNRPENPQFNYTQEAQKGHYAFDFGRGILPVSLKPGKYAKSVTELLAVGAFDVVKYADSINKILSVYSVNINEAANLLNLFNANYSNFETGDEIYGAIITAEKEGFETKTIAANLYTNRQYNFSEKQNLGIYSFIYKNIPEQKIRLEIIKTILDKSSELGIRTESASAYCDDIKSKANFILENYNDYIRQSGGPSNYITQNQNNFAKTFFLYDFLIQKSAQTFNSAASEETTACKTIMGMVFKKQLLPELDLLIQTANANYSGLGIDVLCSTVTEHINSGIFSSNIGFSFEILKRLYPKKNIAYQFLLRLIKLNFRQETFIKTYINEQSKKNSFYNDFEKLNKEDESFAKFCKKKDAYSFQIQPLSLDTLKEYFNKYYITGQDSGIFIKRFQEYLNTIQAEKKLNEYNNVIDALSFSNNVSKQLVVQVYSAILKAIFSLPFDKIDKAVQNHAFFDKIVPLYKETINAGGALDQKIKETISIALCGRVLLEYDFNAKNMSTGNFFNRHKEKEKTDAFINNIQTINTVDGINTFIDYYFQPVVNILICGAAINTEQNNFEANAEKTFGKIIENGDKKKIAEYIIYGMKQKDKITIMFILFIFRKKFTSSQTALNEKYGSIAEEIFELLSSGERKRIFSELLEKADRSEQAAFENYFKKFNETHKGGFLKNLFGKQQ
jgi:hypothetical protein